MYVCMYVCTHQCVQIQNYMNKLIDWNVKWQMSFSISSRRIMHIDDKNRNFKHLIHYQELSKVKHETGLGVIISNNLKMSGQFTAVSRKANLMLILISGISDHKPPDVIKGSIQHL